jgi:23S rRNA (cytosine1962-C5)-methyltransferase
MVLAMQAGRCRLTWRRARVCNQCPRRVANRQASATLFSADQYALLDYGDGRKLERFGAYLLDRPSPAAANLNRVTPDLWSTATASFLGTNGAGSSLGQRGRWVAHAPLPAAWAIEHSPLVLELRPTEFGHVGVFPEQAENWNWIASQVGRLRDLHAASTQPPSARPRVLNLFAYTGASTLAAAAAGAEVVHIDASKSTVAWARRNAELSGVSDAPIRWIVEDAARFVAREAKRGNRYQGIVLDPPSYGHGPKGSAWQIERDLPQLLEHCGRLLAEDAGFLLLSCHSPGIRSTDLKKQLLKSIPKSQPRETEGADLFLTSDDGRQLHSGVAARWTNR